MTQHASAGDTTCIGLAPLGMQTGSSVEHAAVAVGGFAGENQQWLRRRDTNQKQGCLLGLAEPFFVCTT